MEISRTHLADILYVMLHRNESDVTAGHLWEKSSAKRLNFNYFVSYVIFYETKSQLSNYASFIMKFKISFYNSI